MNILTAGAVLTDVWKAIPNSEARIAETIRRTPTGRLVTAEEISYGAHSSVPTPPQGSSAIPLFSTVARGSWPKLK